MRNYLKYLNDTLYSFQRKYDLTDNQMRFLLFINDEKGSFTKRFIKESMYISKKFNDRMFPELVKRDYIFVFEKRSWDSNQPNQYRVTNKTHRLINKFYNVLEGTEEI
tara:strand:+ start:1184 stop:1507 length:324 start_codon:yes stop_codon:yes gene_type:complete